MVKSKCSRNILNFEISKSTMRGDTCSIFENFRFSPSNSKNHVFTHFCTSSIFKNFLPPGTPYRGPIPPYDPPKPKISEILTSPKSCPKPIPNVFLRYPKIFCKILPCHRRHFFAIFRDFPRFSPKMAKIEKY